ncbi:dTDP-4-dehydrorhamnose reductase [Mucilaginibacter sp. JRF]|uniref:dTDP-4-dehydrorhamnose reductase n=1 Tax=Mucilaginibacter sp. JRF TaxID=2780088 RepID=UPI00187F2331|nr:dTDP-4-dehydrorhamnose reductase [Mucilaginibacter sp. JRF]MBE9585233.1 dTDP-4-dehydrorhamnose reductase [Mucilaginibacter sp. JRF]
MKNIVIFGANGQLGTCFKQIAENEGITEIYFPGEGEANILDLDGLKKIFETQRPAYAINCAAYTAVDKAEDDYETADKVNKVGAENLAKFCLEYGTTLIHTSTDFVFEGNASTPRVEDDIAKPINAYGQTKLDGELAISSVLEKYFILRTSWLYSEYGNNFVKTMLKLGAEREQLTIIADQVGTPTYGIDLAYAILEIIKTESTAYGLYHYSNEGVASWYDFAKAIFALSETHVKTLPIPTSAYKTRAVRPAYSVMDKSKIKNALSIEIPYWRDSLEICINRLKNN